MRPLTLRHTGRKDAKYRSRMRCEASEVGCELLATPHLRPTGFDPPFRRNGACDWVQPLKDGVADDRGQAAPCARAGRNTLSQGRRGGSG
eukprot:scaffold33728_cov101-Isochrysis_galbana.AAC.3